MLVGALLPRSQALRAGASFSAAYFFAELSSEPCELRAWSTYSRPVLGSRARLSELDVKLAEHSNCQKLRDLTECYPCLPIQMPFSTALSR
jgi:hypothetical protein